MHYECIIKVIPIGMHNLSFFEQASAGVEQLNSAYVKGRLLNDKLVSCKK